MYRGNCLKRALHIFKVGGAWQKKEGDVFPPQKHHSLFYAKLPPTLTPSIHTMKRDKNNRLIEN